MDSSIKLEKDDHISLKLDCGNDWKSRELLMATFGLYQGPHVWQVKKIINNNINNKKESWKPKKVTWKKEK